MSSDLLLAPRATFQKGQAAGEDIVAPRRIEFVSQIRTEIEQRRAAAAVSEVYDPLNRQVGREQVGLALQILSFVDSVRSDPYATPEYRKYCLESIIFVRFSPQVISDTLALSEADWKAVQLETRRVLDEIMKQEIKAGQEDARRREVRSLIAFELSESQAAIVDEIASALVKANRPYNPQKTELARQSAMDTAQPVKVVLEENQIIVRSGEIVTDEDIEAMDALGMLNPSVDWLTVSSSSLFALSLSIALAVYLWNNEFELRARAHHLLLLLLLLLLFTFLARWGVFQPAFQPFLIPLSTLALLVTALFNVRLGLAVHLVVCVVIVYAARDQQGLFWYYLVGGLVGAFAMRRVHRINTFVWAGGYLMVANAVTILTFVLLDGEFGTLQLGQLFLAGAANGALVAILTLGGYYLLGTAFQITTSLQLMDLARPTHPLLRDLLLKAPGTYHHSILVGNMAEQAAETIGADALLARVGAFYHDIGKTMRPYFFTENQMDGMNPHDQMLPETSAEIIRSHTADGLVLARKYHLPRVLQSFITEHHGTGTISYFYHKAVQQYGQDDIQEDAYRYAGPRPQTKETAIVMLADTCEAAVRSVHPHNAEELEKLIRSLIAQKLATGELNNTPLTLQEIETITLSFIDTLQGVFHPRIRYPGSEPRPASEPVAVPASGSQPRGIQGSPQVTQELEAVLVKGPQNDSSADSPPVSGPDAG